MTTNTTQYKNHDNSEKVEKNIWQALKELKNATGSWTDLAKKIYRNMGKYIYGDIYGDIYEDFELKAEEEEAELKKFAQNLQKAVERKQEKTTVDERTIFLKDICDYFQLDYKNSPAPLKTLPHKDNYIAYNKGILLEKRFDWDLFIEKELNKVEAMANNGFKEAQTLLAHFYYYCGKNHIRNIAKALELYKKAAEQNDELALYQLGRIYEYGDEGVTIDKNQAFKFYKLAEQYNCTLVFSKIAYCYYTGIGTSKNLEKFFEYAKRCEADEIKDEIGLLYLAFAYSEGIGTNKNLQNAIEVYKSLLPLENAKPYIMEIYLTLCKLYKTEGKQQNLELADEYFNNYLKIWCETARQAWERNNIDFIYKIANASPERYHNILKNAHYDYVNNPDNPTVVNAFLQSAL